MGGDDDPRGRSGLDHEHGLGAGGASKVRTPPLDCMTRSWPLSPESRRRDSMLERYRSTMGRTPALIRVVLARKYSRNSGATSEESETTASGNTSCTNFARSVLVPGIEVGVEIADRNRFHALVLQLPGGGRNRLLVQRRHHFPPPSPAAPGMPKHRYRAARGRGFSNSRS